MLRRSLTIHRIILEVNTLFMEPHKIIASIVDIADCAISLRQRLRRADPSSPPRCARKHGFRKELREDPAQSSLN